MKQNQLSPCNRCRGFSIIEIMVVLVIASIAYSTVAGIGARENSGKELLLGSNVLALQQKGSYAYRAYCNDQATPSGNMTSLLLTRQLLESGDLKNPFGIPLSISVFKNTPAIIEITASIDPQFDAQTIAANTGATLVSGRNIIWRRNVTSLAGTYSAHAMDHTKQNSGTRCE